MLGGKGHDVPDDIKNKAMEIFQTDYLKGGAA